MLETDHVAEDLRAHGGDYADMFAALFTAHAPELELVRYDAVAGALPASPDAEDAWLITGSRWSVYDDEPWIADLLAFIREVDAAGRPLVGICFGHQAIAHALGGRTARSERGWGVGVHAAEVVEARPWMTPAASAYRLLVLHQDQVCELPAQATALACSPHCDVALFEIDARILGVQGHPEFSAPYVAALVDERTHVIPPAVVDRARDSLAEPTDEGLLAGWIAEFLRRAHAAR